MNENENNFESLRKLLSLKKHEVPPPGYFSNFSSRVVAGIRQGETARSASFTAKLFAEAPWLLSLIQKFEAKPAFAGVFASALCLLLVAGIVWTDHPITPTEPMMPAQASESGPAMASVTPSFLDQPTTSSGLVSSTNPVLSFEPGSPAFSQNPLLQAVDLH
jgi:hypothetical protein